MKHFILTFLSLVTILTVNAQTSPRIYFSSITASENTGQDYTSWLTDDLNTLVPNAWENNFKYVDVTLKLTGKSYINRISLYDYEGIFTDKPALIYALNGNEKIFLGSFDGPGYMSWVNWQLPTPVLADAICIHKYSNNIPQKVQVFGQQAAALTNLQPVPGKIEAESYVTMQGVQTEPTSDEGGGLNVGWINDGDWMDYNVSVAQSGLYTLTFRTANGYGNGIIQVRSENGTVLQSTSVPLSGGWQGWSSVRTTIKLAQGDQTLRIHAINGDFNFNWFSFTPATNIPGVIQAENHSGMYGIQTETTSDEGGGLNVGWINDGDWMDYAVNVPAAGSYTASFRVSNSWGSGIIQLKNAADSVLATLAVPQTGGWQSWTTLTTNVTLPAGGQKLRVYAQVGDWNFNWLSFSSNGTVTPPTPPASSTAVKIAVDPKRWYQLNNVSNGLEGLFDGNTQTQVNTGWGKVLANYDAYYPLKPGETMRIEKIKFFDGEGSMKDNPMTLSVITDQWQRIPIATFTGEEYNGWVGPYPDRQLSGEAKFMLDVPITNARYLVINAWWGYPTEIELYGSYTPPTATTTAVPQKSPKFKDMVGVNAFEWDFEDGQNPTVINETKMQAVKTFAGIRHYMDWEKLESTEGGYTYNPTHSGGWNYDVIYERCKADGIEVLACLKTLPNWMLNTYPSSDRDTENVPVRYGKDFADPLSYLEQAKVAFQYIARYGSNTSVDPSLLHVNSSQRWTGDGINTVKIGLGVIKYIECDNERDKWWKGRKGYQTAREYAANLSAFYDGHKNTMGAGVGVKNADPSVQVVIGGMASVYAGDDYLRGMIDWCRQYRGYRPDGSVNVCWDVINYHLYPDNANSSQSGQSTRGAAPEKSSAGLVASQILQTAHDQLNDMPVWITETGYDVNQGSSLKAIAIGAKSVLQTQADWILRTSLFYARNGIDKVFFYQLYDDNFNNPIQFGSSGLVNPDQSRKPAADFLLQTKNLLGDYQYKQTLHADPIVDRYEKNGKSIYALVVPDEVGRTANYSLNLGNTNIAKALVFTPQAGASAMHIDTVAVNQGVLTLTVTETPVFVKALEISGARVAITPEAVETLATTVKVFPNPTSDYVQVSLPNPSLQPVSIVLFDAQAGTLHRQIEVSQAGNAVNERIDLSRLAPGAYVIDVKRGNERAFRKVIKVN